MFKNDDFVQILDFIRIDYKNSILSERKKIMLFQMILNKLDKNLSQKKETLFTLKKYLKKQKNCTYKNIHILINSIEDEIRNNKIYFNNRDLERVKKIEPNLFKHLN